MALFVSPFAQYTDASGNPGSGYKLYFYQTTTTTPITIYSDSLFATPVANPAIADSAGQWAAIYVNTGTYKVVMKSAADVTIRTADPVSGNPVSGPTSATDNALARFDGTTGKLLQNGLATEDDSGNISGVVGLTMTGNLVAVGGAFSGAVSGTTGTFSAGVSGTTGTFSGAVTAAGLQPLTLTYTDAGASNGPVFEMFRNSASPAALDAIGALRFTANDSGSNNTIYGQIAGQIDDPTNGTEDGTINFYTMKAGTLTLKGSMFDTGFTISGTSAALIDPAGAVVGASMSTAGSYANYMTSGVNLNLGHSANGDFAYFWITGVNQGSISGAGATISYNAFFASHWSQLADGSKPDIPCGTIVETIDQMCGWPLLSYIDHDGEAQQREAVPVGAKIGDVIDYSYERDKVIQVEVKEDVFAEIDADHYEMKNGAAILGSAKKLVPVFDIVPIVDDGGKPVIVSTREIADDGTLIIRNDPKFLRVQRTRKVMQDKTIKVIETVKAKVLAGTDDRLPRFKISDTAGSKAVYGVFSRWDGDSHDAYIGSLGAYFIRIAKGVKVAVGDLIESNGDGCGRVQSDDMMRSSTVAKVTAAIVSETYPDGSYLVPCTLHCG